MDIVIGNANFSGSGLGKSTAAANIIEQTGSTNEVANNALINLNRSLLASTIWNKNLKIFPMWGGTQASMAYNLKDITADALTFPQSLSGQFTAAGYVGSNVAGSTGGYINTAYVPSGVISKFTIGVYNITAESATNDHMLGGVAISSSFALGLFRDYTDRTGGGLKSIPGTVGLSSYTLAGSGYDRTKTGLLLATCEADANLYDNGVLIGTTAGIQPVDAAANTRALVFGAHRTGSSIFLGTACTLRFIIYGPDVLTSSEVTTLTSIVNKYVADLAL